MSATNFMPFTFLGSVPREETLVEIDKDLLVSGKALSSSGKPLSKEPTLGDLYEDFSIDAYKENFSRDLDRALEVNEECLSNSLAGLDEHSTYSKTFLDFRESFGGSYREPFLTSISAFELTQMKEYSDLLAELIYRFHLRRAEIVFQELPREEALEYLFVTASIYQYTDYNFSKEGLLPLGLPTAFSLKGNRQLSVFERFYYLAYLAYFLMNFRNEPSQYSKKGSLVPGYFIKEGFLKLFNTGFESLSSGKHEKAPAPDKSYTLVATYALFEILQETELAYERLEDKFKSLYKDLEEHLGDNPQGPGTSIDPVHRESFIEFFSEKNKDLSKVIDTLRNKVSPVEGTSLWGRLGFFELGQALVAYYKVCSSITSIEEGFSGKTLPGATIQEILSSLRASKELILSRDLCRSEISAYLGTTIRDLTEKEFIERFLESYWLMPALEMSGDWDLHEAIDIAKDDCIQEIYKHSDSLASAVKAVKEALDDEELRKELSLYAAS